jgi:hypothetical protein
MTLDQAVVQLRESLAQVINSFQLPLSTKALVLQNMWLQLEVLMTQQPSEPQEKPPKEEDAE